jgi:signal transduction histidine kinase
MNTILPIPENELERITSLSELDLDYTEIKDSLNDLARLAAKVAGTSISLVNLIDSFTQWTVSNYGLPLEQMTRDESVCQYTIVSKESFEVKDLSDDHRFRDKFYVSGPPCVRYYFGVPLQTLDGFHLGALCVLDSKGKEITPEKIELLKIIAREIVSRLTTFHAIQLLKSRVREATESQRKVAHDIRGPLGGIISLAEIISEQGNQNKMDEVLSFIELIQRSGNSLLELADEILSVEESYQLGSENETGGSELNLLLFREKLIKLYSPQAVSKGIHFDVELTTHNERTPFSKSKLLQIAGNLVSNAIKFTQQGGSVCVYLTLSVQAEENMLEIRVKDTGVGLTPEEIRSITQGRASTTEGTKGEKGYGFGLELVKHLVEGLHGSMQISSPQGGGAHFEIRLPLKK